jgi:RNase P subunit RPR2
VRPLPPDEPPSRPTPRSKPTTVRVELTCLMCGELAGVIENRRLIRPRASGSLRYDGRRLTCGRCGSMLLPGEEYHSPTPEDTGAVQ